MTEDELRQGLFKLIDERDDHALRYQLRNEVEKDIEAGKYTEDYWLDLIQQMINDGELIETVDEDGNLIVLPKEE